MRELLRWLFNISGKELDNATDMLSKDTAKQRLKLVLIQDRLVKSGVINPSLAVPRIPSVPKYLRDITCPHSLSLQQTF